MEQEVNATSFPAKLHRMLTDIDRAGNGMERVVSWTVHGTSFVIRNKKSFIANIMPKYFYQLKYNSFARQLNLHGFRKKTQGPDKGSFYHDLFRKNEPRLALLITRGKGKSVKARAKAAESDQIRHSPGARNQGESAASFGSSYVTSICQGASVPLAATSEIQLESSRAVAASVAPQTEGQPTQNSRDNQPLNQFSRHPSYVASSLLLSNLGNRRQRDRRCEQGQSWSRELSVPQSLHVAEMDQSAPVITALGTQSLSALPLSSLEPDPIRPPICTVGTLNFTSGTVSEMPTAHLDLEPTPLGPGGMESPKISVTRRDPAILQNTSFDPTNLQNNLSAFLASAGPSTKEKGLCLGDNDDDSCGSSLSALFYGSA